MASAMVNVFVLQQGGTWESWPGRYSPRRKQLFLFFCEAPGLTFFSWTHGNEKGIIKERIAFLFFPVSPLSFRSSELDHIAHTLPRRDAEERRSEIIVVSPFIS